MTFSPFDDPQDFLGNLFDGTDSAPGLDGASIPLWHSSIGPHGEPGKEIIGVKVPPSEAISVVEGDYDTISAYRRELFAANLTVEDYEGKEHPDALERSVVENLFEANVYSSALIDEDGKRTGFHTIAIDIDHPVRLRETDTPGHYHLLIDVPMPWESYKALLEELTDAGVVEPGYLQASIEREATCLRLPWVHKPRVTDDGQQIVIFSEAGEYVETKLATPEPGVIEFDPGQYDVEFVGGKGVLRRRKA